MNCSMYNNIIVYICSIMLINKKYLRYIFIFCSSLYFLIGQNLQNLGLDNKDQLLKLSESFVVETEIDPETYILGPGDKIGLSIITGANLAYVITISPTGELWIPDIGTVHISGMNIQIAEEFAAQYIRENRYKTANISLVLLNIRHHKIQVVGAVISPGFINIKSISRLTDAIKKTDGLHKLADEEHIVIKKENGAEIICSLKSFHLNGNLNNNPVLSAGDIIYVPYDIKFEKEIKKSISHKQSMIYVTGYVLRPTGHKYIPGYRINDYIAMSGGITDFGNEKKFTISRNGELLSKNEIGMLEPGDQINIPANMKYRMLGNMSILQTMTAFMTLFLAYQATVNN